MNPNATTPKNTPVQFGLKGQNVIGKFSHIAPNGKAYIKYDGTGYERKLDKVLITGEATTEFTVENAGNAPAATPNPALNIDINERFDMFSTLIEMVCSPNSDRLSMVVTGEGGLGKNHTVKETLGALGLKEIKRLALAEAEGDEFDEDEIEELAKGGQVVSGHYKFIKGHSTPKGLYNNLYEFRDKIIIFDDCDSVLKDLTAINILKGALDSYDERIISWASAAFFSGDDIPTEFEFTGQIIFLSNLPKTRIPQPILSRATNLDLSMTSEDKISRMREVIKNPQFKAGIPMNTKKAALECLEEHKNVCTNLNFRTLQEIIDFIDFDKTGKKWQNLAKYVIHNS